MQRRLPRVRRRGGGRPRHRAVPVARGAASRVCGCCGRSTPWPRATAGASGDPGDERPSPHRLPGDGRAMSALLQRMVTRARAPLSSVAAGDAPALRPRRAGLAPGRSRAGSRSSGARVPASPTPAGHRSTAGAASHRHCPERPGREIGRPLQRPRAPASRGARRDATAGGVTQRAPAARRRRASTARRPRRERRRRSGLSAAAATPSSRHDRERPAPRTPDPPTDYLEPTGAPAAPRAACGDASASSQPPADEPARPRAPADRPR